MGLGHGLEAFAEHRGGNVLPVFVFLYRGDVEPFFRAVRHIHHDDDFRGLEGVQQHPHGLLRVQAVEAQFPQVVALDAVTCVSVHGDNEVGPYVPAYFLPLGNGFQNVPRNRAQLFFPDGQPRGVARRLQSGMFGPCAEVATPAIRLALQIGHVRHVHEPQAAFKLLLDDVLEDFHRACRVRRSGRVMEKPDVQLVAEVRYQRRRIGRAGVRVKNARQPVRGIAVSPVGHELCQSAQHAFRRFARGLLITNIKGVGSVVDNDIAHDAPVADLDKVFRFLGVIGPLVQKDDALCAAYAVEDADRGVQQPGVVRMQGADAPRGLSLFELFRVAAITPHGPAYGFDRGHEDFPRFRVGDAFPVALCDMDGELQRHDLLAVGAREEHEFGNLPAQAFRHACFSLAAARLLPACPARILFQVSVCGIDRDPQRGGQALHDDAAFPRAGVGRVKLPCDIAHKPGLFGCKGRSHAARL